MTNHAVKLSMLSDFAHDVVKIGGASRAPPPTSGKRQLPDKQQLAVQVSVKSLGSERKLNIRQKVAQNDRAVECTEFIPGIYKSECG